MNKYIFYAIILLVVAGAGIFYVINNINNKSSNIESNIVKLSQEINKQTEENNVIKNEESTSKNTVYDSWIKEIEEKASFVMLKDEAESFITDLEAANESPLHQNTIMNTGMLLDELIIAIENSDNTADNLKVDFDSDGLSNRDELIYKTDANNPDTDGDGYLDGDEVKGGYNPKGGGKIDWKQDLLKYESLFFNISFNYPAGWKIDDVVQNQGSNKITSFYKDEYDKLTGLAVKKIIFVGPIDSINVENKNTIQAIDVFYKSYQTNKFRIVSYDGNKNIEIVKVIIGEPDKNGYVAEDLYFNNNGKIIRIDVQTVPHLPEAYNNDDEINTIISSMKFLKN